MSPLTAAFRRINRALAAAVLPALVAACAITDDKPPADAARRDLAFSDVARGGDWRPPFGVRLIKDAAAWQTLARDLYLPAAAAPDFRREMIIVASLGERRTGGYDIAVTAVYESRGALVVEVRETSPPAGALVSQALNWPVHVVKTARSDLPLRAEFSSAAPAY